jgi:hypothetical protein
MSDKKETKITNAIRLTFSYKGTDIKLISQDKIEKILPPSSNISNRSGSWYEVADDKQNLLYQRIISNPLQTDIEVFSNESKESIMRQKISQIEGVFSILIPDLPEAKTFSLFSSPIERGEIAVQKEATKIFQMDLNEEGGNKQ